MRVTRLKADVFPQHRPKVWIVVADEADEKLQWPERMGTAAEN
jgi:hypothetical protein